MKRVLIIDNYDSFTHNLYQALGSLGAEVVVYRNDAVDLAGIAAWHPTHIVLSPGPGHPARQRTLVFARPQFTILVPRFRSSGCVSATRELPIIWADG